MPTTRPATVRRTAPEYWTFTIPGIASGTRRTWRQAYDDADLIARLTTRSAWPRNLPKRTPGTALAELLTGSTLADDLHWPPTPSPGVSYPQTGPITDVQLRPPATTPSWYELNAPKDWPDDERRTPPDTCTDCLDIGHTEPWPAAPTTTPTTAAREPAGPASSPATAPTATPPSAESGTAPSPPGHPAPAGTSATTTTPATSEDPNTPDPATDGKAQSEATGPELDDPFAPYGYHLPRE